MKHRLHTIIKNNLKLANMQAQALIETEEARDIEVYTEEYYTEKLENINLKINELIDELTQKY